MNHMKLSQASGKPALMEDRGSRMSLVPARPLETLFVQAVEIYSMVNGGDLRNLIHNLGARTVGQRIS